MVVEGLFEVVVVELGEVMELLLCWDGVFVVQDGEVFVLCDVDVVGVEWLYWFCDVMWVVEVVICG